MKKAIKIGLVILGVLLVLVLAFLALVYIPSPKFEPVAHKAIAPQFWPTKQWQNSTPEEQGLDSGKLVEMVEFYQEKRAENKQVRIDSFTVIRNGYVVADLYFNPLYPQDSAHIIHSCTKSIMSLLIGIAIDEGFLKSVDTPVYDIFKDQGYTVSDERMKKVTVKHLLAMNTGIRSQDDRPYKYRGLFKVQHTQNWVETFLKLPMDVEPGVRFDYSNLASFMLSAVIQKTTGMDTLSFAKERLFSPLGIHEVQWEKNLQGIYIGWARMWLKPHDMAKIGLLYLQKGRWNNEQILPAKWVTESVTPHSYPKNYKDILDENGVKNSEESGGNWIATKFLKPFQDGYGYQIWLDGSGSYAAMGTSGQYIMVNPEKNLIVVATSKLTGLDTFLPLKMIEDFVLPAIKSDKALPPQEQFQKQLATFSKPPKSSFQATNVPKLPETALRISGAIYQMDKNDWNYNNFQLKFDSNRDFAELNYTAKLGEVIKMRVGLDNVPRMTETNNQTYAGVGHWSADSTFTVMYEVVGYSTQDQWNFTFSDTTLIVEEINEITGKKTYSGMMN